MKQTDQPSAMRERLEEYKKQAHSGWNTLVLYVDDRMKEKLWPVIEGIAQLLFTYIPQLEKENRELRQAAQIPSEKIEEMARTLVEAFNDRGRTFDNSPDRSEVADLLREGLGGGK